MANLSYFAFIASFITFGVALLAYLWFTVLRQKQAGRFATFFTYNGAALLAASLGARWVAAGHPPYSNQFEFATSFAWGTAATYLYLEHRYRLRSLGIVAVGVAFALLAYASALPARIDPLIAALQNRPLLTIHVALAIISAGAVPRAFAAGVLYLINRRGQFAFLPHPEILDEIGYKSVIIGFPAQTLLLILGAVWANVAWGAYWQWDPKETAALFTWLIYGVYLHARVQRGWHGVRTSWLLLAGFGAVMFTFFGNYFLGGLHTYSGL
jgi:cytochrome c-type biogenesis protein CcsB